MNRLPGVVCVLAVMKPGANWPMQFLKRVMAVAGQFRQL